MSSVPNEANVERSTPDEAVVDNHMPDEVMRETAPIEVSTPEVSEAALLGPVCARCGQMLRTGELACPNCGLVVNHSIETRKIEEPSSIPPAGRQPAGEAIADKEKPIIFEIAGGAPPLHLAIKETLIVGRRVPGEQELDVDLSPYGAEKEGVSRRHLQLKRSGDLIYITDLHSTNRTYLNGRCLQPGGTRLLRSGDEIQLGRLKVRVRF